MNASRKIGIQNLPNHLVNNLIMPSLSKTDLAMLAATSKQGPGSGARAALAARKTNAAAGIWTHAKPHIDCFRKAARRILLMIRRDAPYDVVREAKEELDRLGCTMDTSYVRVRVTGEDSTGFMLCEISTDAPYVRIVVAVSIDRQASALGRNGKVKEHLRVTTAADMVVDFLGITTDIGQAANGRLNAGVVLEPLTRAPGGALVYAYSINDEQLALYNDIVVPTSPAFYVYRYAILGEPQWASVSGDPYTRVASVVPALGMQSYLLEKLRNRGTASLYRKRVRHLVGAAQQEAARIIARGTAHTVFARVPYLRRALAAAVVKNEPQILSTSQARGGLHHANARPYLHGRIRKSKRYTGEEVNATANAVRARTNVPKTWGALQKLKAAVASLR
jgi:hypothetical protein